MDNTIGRPAEFYLDLIDNCNTASSTIMKKAEEDKKAAEISALKQKVQDNFKDAFSDPQPATTVTTKSKKKTTKKKKRK